MLFGKYKAAFVDGSPTKVRVPCLICYANIFEPKAAPGSDDKKFSVSCLIDQTDTDTLAVVKKAIDNAKELGKSKLWGGKIPTGPNVAPGIRNGDERPDDEPYHGRMFINATSKEAPEIVGRHKERITDPMEVYSGCYCYVTINFYPFNVSMNKGVAAGLNNIQLIRQGDKLSGKASANNDFEDLGDDDEVLGDDLPDYLK